MLAWFRRNLFLKIQLTNCQKKKKTTITNKLAIVKKLTINKFGQSMKKDNLFIYKSDNLNLLKPCNILFQCSV